MVRVKVESQEFQCDDKIKGEKVFSPTDGESVLLE